MNDNKIYFSSIISEIINFDCGLEFFNPDHYGMFRRFKNGKIKLLKTFKTKLGCESHANHRNRCALEDYGTDLIKLNGAKK